MVIRITVTSQRKWERGAAMLQGPLSLLADHWIWFALAYLASCAFVLALCRAAKLGDEMREHVALDLPASESARRAIAQPTPREHEAPSTAGLPMLPGALEGNAGVATDRAGELQIVLATALTESRELDLGEGVAELAHRFLRECARPGARESLLLGGKIGGPQAEGARRKPPGFLPIARAHTIAEIEGHRLKLLMVVD